jgi:hypothetical protein
LNYFEILDKKREKKRIRTYKMASSIESSHLLLLPSINTFHFNNSITQEIKLSVSPINDSCSNDSGHHSEASSSSSSSTSSLSANSSTISPFSVKIARFTQQQQNHSQLIKTNDTSNQFDSFYNSQDVIINHETISSPKINHSWLLLNPSLAHLPREFSHSLNNHSQFQSTPNKPLKRVNFHSIHDLAESSNDTNNSQLDNPVITIASIKSDPPIQSGSFLAANKQFNDHLNSFKTENDKENQDYYQKVDIKFIF